MISPRWGQFPIGPLLRRERDLRLYFDQFVDARDEVSRFKGRFLQLRSKLVPEGDVGNVTVDDAVCVEFSGYGEYFGPLVGHHTFLREKLWNIVHPARLAEIQKETADPIGIHVRLGDFRVAKSAEELFQSGGIRTPIDWFVECLRYVRACIGHTTPAFIVSDGSNEELARLLSEGNVRRIETGSAIGDMLLLSKASVIVGTGGSSFNAWAAYLDQTPLLTVPGQDAAWFKLRHPNGAFVGVFDPANPSPDLKPCLEGLGTNPTPETI